MPNMSHREVDLSDDDGSDDDYTVDPDLEYIRLPHKLGLTLQGRRGGDVIH